MTILLVLGGLAFKIAAVPFHSWAPDAYQGASAPVAAFLAAGSKAAGLAALGRVTLVAYGSAAEVVSVFLAGLAALSIVVGTITLLAQTDMKRLLAYSSIAHAGYAILGLIAGTPAGISATMTYAFFYVFMTLGAFGVVIALGKRGATLDGYRGLAAQRPVAAALMLLFLLSLTGFPPTAGFVAKFVVILSAVRAGHIDARGAGRGLQCGVGLRLHARGRVHVYEGAPGAGPVTLAGGGVRGAYGGRAGHSDRWNLTRQSHVLGGVTMNASNPAMNAGSPVTLRAEVVTSERICRDCSEHCSRRRDHRRDGGAGLNPGEEEP